MSIHDVYLYIEPPEVANNNYFGFDFDGRPIEFRVIPKEKPGRLEKPFRTTIMIRAFLTSQTPNCNAFKAALLSRLKHLFAERPELRAKNNLTNLNLDELKALANFYFQ